MRLTNRSFWCQPTGCTKRERQQETHQERIYSTLFLFWLRKVILADVRFSIRLLKKSLINIWVLLYIQSQDLSAQWCMHIRHKRITNITLIDKEEFFITKGVSLKDAGFTFFVHRRTHKDTDLSHHIIMP